MIWSDRRPRVSPRRLAASSGLEMLLGRPRSRKTFWVQLGTLIADGHGQDARDLVAIWETICSSIWPASRLLGSYWSLGLYCTLGSYIYLHASVCIPALLPKLRPRALVVDKPVWEDECWLISEVYKKMLPFFFLLSFNQRDKYQDMKCRKLLIRYYTKLQGTQFLELYKFDMLIV